MLSFFFCCTTYVLIFCNSLSHISCHFANKRDIYIAILPLIIIFATHNLQHKAQQVYELFIKPAGYKALLNLSQTEMGIKKIKDFFQQNLSSELRLRRVTAPLFVLKGMGINDDLNGTERAVTFPIKDLNDSKAEIVHSLAKWKRLTLADYNIEEGYGIYTDMNAIRSDEELGNLHSLYVDQWDWERVMSPSERNIEYLKEIVRRIYAAMVRTEYLVYEMFPNIRPTLPQQIHFIHSEDLLQKYLPLHRKNGKTPFARNTELYSLSVSDAS